VAAAAQPETASDVEDDAFEESAPVPTASVAVTTQADDLAADPVPEVEDLRDVESQLAGNPTDSAVEAPKKKKWRMFRKGGDA
jgi:hypothetical protein